MKKLLLIAVAALLAAPLASLVDIGVAQQPGGERPRPGDAYRTFAPSGAWVWFIDPRAVYHKGERERTWAGWVNDAGDIQVGAYDHASGEITRSTLHEKLQVDDHDDPALLVRPDGRLTAFYSGHGGPEMYYRTTERPGDISAWGEERRLPVNTEGRYGYTYPNPIHLSAEDNRLYLFWRGGNFKPNFSTTDDPTLAPDSWAPAKTLIQGEGARPYVKYASNGEDTIHIAFTDGHPRREPTNSIYYMRYRDGALRGADGSRIAAMDGGLPVEPREADVVYDGRETGVRAWVWDVAADERGRPVIVYAALPEKTEHRYRYARWTGEEWVDHEITPAGGWFPQTPEGETEPEPHYSGGVILDHNDPSTVYLSREIDGVFEIERWTTGDGGETWSHEPITANSEKNNVRPVVPRNHPGGDTAAGLLWMHGDYIHYTDYDTSIKMLGGADGEGSTDRRASDKE